MKAKKIENINDLKEIIETVIMPDIMKKEL